MTNSASAPKLVPVVANDAVRLPGCEQKLGPSAGSLRPTATNRLTLAQMKDVARLTEAADTRPDHRNRR
jgi:hypothetical protein